MDTFSFSRLNMYQRCPRRFYYKYVLGFEEDTTLPLALGKAVHKAIESLFEGMKIEDAVSEGIIEGEFHEDVTREDILWFLSRVPFENLRGETELYFRVPLFDDERAYLRGYIDLWDNHKSESEIVDYKTNRKTYHVEDNYQLGLYAWAVKKAKQLDGNVKGKLLFLRQRHASIATFDDNEMNEAVTWARNLVEQIQLRLDFLDVFPDEDKDLFPYQPSVDCEHCPFAIECYRDFPLN